MNETSILWRVQQFIHPLAQSDKAQGWREANTEALLQTLGEATT